MKKLIILLIALMFNISTSQASIYYYTTLKGLVNAPDGIFASSESANGDVTITGLDDMVISVDETGDIIESFTVSAIDGIDLSTVSLQAEIISGEIIDTVSITKNSNSEYDLVITLPTELSSGSIEVKVLATISNIVKAYKTVKVSVTGGCNTENPLENIANEDDYYLLGGEDGNSELAKEELICISNYQTDAVLQSNYKLMANVTFAGSSEDWDIVGDLDSEGWKPLGKLIFLDEENGIPDENYAFTGIFNGNNKTVNNLYINRPETGILYGQGLFGIIIRSNISNLGLNDINITGGNGIGGLTGHNYKGSIITNCYAIGKVHGIDNHVGGLVGISLWNSKIIDSHASVDVTGDLNCVGGLVGVNQEGSKIRNSYATGNIIGINEIGGLVGRDGYYYSNRVTETFGNVYNSYATGNVTGDKKVGGLVGFNSSSSSINNSYATGEINGEENIGGLVGKNGYFLNEIKYPGYITNSYAYWNTVPSGSSYIGGLVGRVINGTISNPNDLCENIGDSTSTANIDGYTCSVSGSLEDITTIQSSWDSSIWSGLGTATPTLK